MKKLKILFLLAPLFLHAAHAQEALSLEDAVARALKGNFDIAVAISQSEIAANNNTWGQTSLSPSIGLTAGFNNAISDQSQNPTAFIQEKLETQAISYGANLNWIVFDGLGMFASKRQLELLEEQSEGNAALVIENAIQALTLAYYDVKLQEERLEVLKEAIALSRDRLNYEEDRRELGAGSTFDVLQFDNAIIADSSSYLQQALALRNAMRNLNLLMGADVEQEWSLTSALKAPEGEYSFDALWDETRNRNQNLRNQVVNSLLASQETRLARSNLYPVVSFNAGITENDNRFQIQALDLAAEGATLNYSANFTLNFNVFNGGRTRRNIKNARIREEIASYSQADLERRVQADLRNALDLYEAQRAIFGLTRKGVENQRTTLEIASERYANGLVNVFDFRSVQLALLNAELARIEATQQLLTTHTQLVRLRGGLLRSAE